MKVKTHYLIAKIATEQRYQWNFLEKCAFCIGTVLPDLSWNQLIHRHFFQASNDYVTNTLKALSGRNTLGAFLKYGKMAHYVSDFCCSVHAHGDIGHVSTHVLYERKLNNFLKENYQLIQNTWQSETEKLHTLSDVLTDYNQGEKMNGIRDLCYAIKATACISNQIAVKRDMCKKVMIKKRTVSYRMLKLFNLM